MRAMSMAAESAIPARGPAASGAGGVSRLGAIALAAVLLSPRAAQGSASDLVAEGLEHYAEANDLEAARDRFAAAQVERPDAPQIDLDLGVVFFRKAEAARQAGDPRRESEHLERAGDYFRRALEKIEPAGASDPAAWPAAGRQLASRASYNLGGSLVRQGKLEAASNAYDEALRFHPDNENARHNLAIVLKAIVERKKREQERKKQDEKLRKKIQEFIARLQELMEKQGSAVARTWASDAASVGATFTSEEINALQDKLKAQAKPGGAPAPGPSPPGSQAGPVLEPEEEIKLTRTLLRQMLSAEQPIQDAELAEQEKTLRDQTRQLTGQMRAFAKDAPQIEVPVQGAQAGQGGGVQGQKGQSGARPPQPPAGQQTMKMPHPYAQAARKASEHTERAADAMGRAYNLLKTPAGTEAVQSAFAAAERDEVEAHLELAKALRALTNPEPPQPQPQQKQDQQDKDKDKDQKKEQKSGEQQPQPQPQQEPKEMDPDEARRLLETLRQEERDLRRRQRQKRAREVPVDRDW